MNTKQYQPEKGTEDYVHVLVSEKQGRTLTEPKIEYYYPAQYEEVSRLAGFKGEVKHDPRKKSEQQADAPALNVVKSAEKLETVEQYRARYKELFREDSPFNLDLPGLKRIVDAAEAKLAELPEGVKPVSEEQAAANKQAGSTADGDTANSGDTTTPADQGQGADADKTPTNKDGWFALFQQTFPEDQTAKDDITIPQIRERLGK